MKRVILSINFIFLCIISIAQVPESFNYQAIPRNGSGGIYPEQPMGVQISILSDSPSGSTVYTETFNATTTSLGILNLQIGQGTPVNGTFAEIDWGTNSFYIKVEIDPAGGSTYINMGTTQLLSVPYALHSKTAENLSDGITETDPVFLSHPVSGITPIMITDWNSAFNWGDHATQGYLKGTPGSMVPAVSTLNISNVSYSTAFVEAEVTSTGGEIIVSRGLCLSELPNPDLNDTVYICGTGGGTYSLNIENLALNTTYYIRSYATNILGTSFGNELSFSTHAVTLPAVITTEVYNISHTSAMGGGNVTDDGGSALLEKGICWSLNPSPSITDSKVAQGSSIGTYNAQINSLTPNTLYYIRSYATNDQGTAYGNELSFTTQTLSLASVTTNVVSAVAYSTATSGGNVTSDNGSAVTDRGICWDITPSPTTESSKYIETGGLGNFTANMTELIPATTYFVRAFAVNGAGTVYGNEYSFTTLSLTEPVLSTKPIVGISSNIAGSGGNITTDGGSSITDKGICWDINPSPGLANSFISSGTGSASYNSTMTGLNPLTLYYVRAYATNGIGTTYGNELSFTTTDLINPGPSVPVIGTSTSTITGSTTASSGGYVSSDGGSTVTERGVCWSTGTNPTLDDNFSVDGDGLGFFTSTITGLSGCDVVYYIRAYATNSTGTGYGNENTVSTGLLPAVTTDDITSISYYTAVSGGSITDDGGCPITEKGICWSYNPNPTINNSKTTEGAGSGSFISNITGLNANRTYYVRAYATNSKGTVYGSEKVFVTATPSTPYIGQNYAGGIVFYIDGTGEHGLVCATVNQGGAAWGCVGTSIPTGFVVGTGPTNTAAIVASCGESNIAAKICDNLVLNGYSDWFLPSRDELNLMYVNLYTQNLGGLSTSTYWSSTESSESNAYSHNFSNNDRGAWFPKSFGFLVHAIRAF